MAFFIKKKKEDRTVTTVKAFEGKPHAGNPRVRFDEGGVAPATPRRVALLCNKALKRSFAFPLAVLLAAVSLGGEGPILKNAGFEETEKGRPASWTLPEYYSLAPGMGRNGTTAIAYSFVTNRPYLAPVAQKVKFEPTETYRISCWVRTENVKPPKGEPGAKIGFEWKDSSGRCEGVYSRQITGTKDWTYMSFLTPQIPKHITSSRVQIYVGYGRTPGRAWFDDVSVEKIEAKPISGLYSDAYRGNVFDRSPVLLKAPINIPARLLSNGAARVELQYRGADGGVRTAKPTALTTTEARFEMRADAFAPGEQSVTCTVFTNGIVAGSAESRIVRKAGPIDWRVRFDRECRTLVDGKPFFPLGMYMGKVTPEELAVYREGPFNCLMPYTEPPREMLDLCHEKKLMVIYPLKEVYRHTNWAKSKKIATEADEVAYVTSHVNANKGHPAILAWYINDEFGPDYADILSRRRALFERLDPQHPTWTCLYQVNQLALYMDSLDCIGTDPYPVGQGGLSLAANWTQLTRRNTFGVRPIWMIPQAFSWAWFRSGRASDRMPTEAEMRTMSWQMVACGANGLIYYAFHQMRRKCGADFPRDWAAVKKVASEIAKHTDIFLADPGPAVACDALETGLCVRSWRRGGETYILAVNATPKPLASDLTVEGAYAATELLFGESVSLVGGNRLAASLSPWGISFVRIK